jgi:AcrR family transcriptional regulator
MSIRSRGARVADAELGRYRHVCGLFEGPNDAEGVLLPFVLEGLDRGDRVIHAVEDRDAYLGGLARRIDVSAALESGQLEIRSWDETYLSGGSFSSRRMLAYIRHVFREGPSLGFAGTRLIGDMEWALTGAPGADELLDYEAGLDEILARPGAWALCAYDVGRYPAHRMAEVMAAHQSAVVGGQFGATEPIAPLPSPRDRVLAAASLLFAENGVSRTGVDTLIEAAGVAKATFYRHFPSKDALIVAWLQDPGTRWFDRVRAQVESQAAGPGDVIPLLFEAVAEWLEAGDFVGCPYLNIAIEVTGTAHPAAEASRTYLAEIGQYLTDSLAKAGHPEAARLGPEVHSLLAGAISLGVANRSSAHALAARDAAMHLITEGDVQEREREREGPQRPLPTRAVD